MLENEKTIYDYLEGSLGQPEQPAAEQQGKQPDKELEEGRPKPKRSKAKQPKVEPPGVDPPRYAPLESRLRNGWFEGDSYLRLKQILAPHGPIPVGRSTWWAGVKTGRFPKPCKPFGERITVWRASDIRALIASN